MTLWPIIGREMKVTARARGTYWLRFGAAALALIISGFLWLTTWGQPMFMTGRIIFTAVSWLAFLGCLLSGLWLTCDSLSEEKREGTLGLLFLTDLRGYHVVLGKLAANSLTALLSVLAVVPVLALTLLMGGMTAPEIARMSLVLVTALHFSLCCGLLVSALCHSARKALLLTFAVVFVFSALAPILGSICEEYWAKSPIIPVLYVISPGCAMVMADASQYTREAWAFWVSIGVAQLLGWLFLVAACRIIPYQWQEQTATIREGSLLGKWHRFSMGGARWRKKFRVKTLAKNPFYWLTSRGRWGRYWVWSPFVVTAGIWWLGWHAEPQNWFEAGTYVTTGICLGGFLKMWVALRAGQNLGEARRMGALELMLTSPLTARQIIAGQWWSLARFFLPSLAGFFSVLWVFAMLDVEKSKFHLYSVFLPLFVLAKGLDEDMQVWKYVIYLIVFAADVATLGWLCQWLSLRLARPHRSTILACLLVLLLPWLMWCVVTMLIVFLGEMLRQSGWVIGDALVFRWFREHPVQIFMLLWMFICLALDLLLLWYSRWRLLRFFQVVAATPVGIWPGYRFRKPKPVPPVLP